MSETEKVQEAIELYFDSMYESSEEKVRKKGIKQICLKEH